MMRRVFFNFLNHLKIGDKKRQAAIRFYGLCLGVKPSCRRCEIFKPVTSKGRRISLKNVLNLVELNIVVTTF